MAKPLILLVEPDQILAQSIGKYLAKKGFKVIWAASAQSAVEAADTDSPDAVVLDLQLAGHGGIELLHELRSYGDWQSIPVIIYSSIHPDEFGGREQAATSLTAAAYLHKPATTLAALAAQIGLCVQVQA